MKKRTKFVFASMVSALLLTACGGQNFPPVDEELFNAIVEEINLGDEDIYGNIYLPEESHGATITWKSSKKDLIFPEWFGNMAPGSVERPAEDTQVKLDAIIEIDGCRSTYSQTVTVKGLPYKVSEEDYEGYLFGHFTGGGNPNTATDEQMYFALAEEGLKFKDISKTPILTSTVGEKGVRDPYICRSYEGDRFFLIATDLSIYNRGGWGNAKGQSASKDGSHSLVMWESTDLVNWGEPRLLPVAREDAGMAWAPEMIYNEEYGEYVIFFSSSIVNEARTEKTKKDAVYFVTTRDFKHISEAQLFIDGQNDPDGKQRVIIDATVMKIGDYYYSATKDGDNNEANGGIRVMRTQDLYNYESWEKVFDLDELGFSASIKLDNSQLEGPEFWKINKKDWADESVPEYGLMADQYNNGKGYLPFKTVDIEDAKNENSSWTMLSNTEYDWSGLTKRHGTILNITGDEIQTIKDYYSL